MKLSSRINQEIVILLVGQRSYIEVNLKSVEDGSGIWTQGPAWTKFMPTGTPLKSSLEVFVPFSNIQFLI